MSESIGIPSNDVLEQYQQTYHEVVKLVEGLNEEQLVWKLSPEKWSVKEVVSHLVDSLLVHSYRIRKVASEPDVKFTSFDQDAWVAHTHGNEADLTELLQSFQLLLRHNGAFFQRADQEAWGRKGLSYKGYEITLSGLVSLFIKHVDTHLAQIRRILQAQEELAPWA